MSTDEAPAERTVDPVTQSSEYRRMLLALLGGDDPAEVAAATPAAIRSLVGEAGQNLRTRPAPTEWSVLECLGHLTDGELVVAGRLRWILAQDQPPILPYDQDDWVTALRHGQDDPEELIALFEAVRKANLALWGRTSEEDRARVGMHAERGPESFELTFRLMAGHDRFHLDQARRTLDAVG